jgi:hypothetical protein
MVSSYAAGRARRVQEALNTHVSSILNVTPSPLAARTLPATLSVSVPPGVLLPGVLAPDCGTDCATKRVLRCAIALGGPAVSCACTHVNKLGGQCGAPHHCIIRPWHVQPESDVHAANRPCTVDIASHLLRCRKGVGIVL